MRIWSPERNKRNFERDFSRGSYGGNPLFSDRKNNQPSRFWFGRLKGDKWLKIRHYFGWMMLVLSLGFAGQQVLSDAVFKLNTLIVTGVSGETEAKIRTIFKEEFLEKKSFLPEANIIFFNSDDFKTIINKYFLFDTVTVRKLLWHSVLVNATERPLAATFINTDGFFAVDSAGIIFRALRDSEIRGITNLPEALKSVQTQSLNGALAVNSNIAVNNLVPLLVSGSSILAEPLGSPNTKSMGVGSLVLPKGDLELIKIIDSNITKTTGSKVSWYGVRSESETVEVILVAGYKLFFTATAPFDVKNKRLDTILRQKLASKINQLEYIDLRYDEKIFYKLKEAGSKPEP